MKKIISLILAVAMVTSVAVIPTQAGALSDKAAGRINADTWTAREVPEGTVVTLSEKTEVTYGSFDAAPTWDDAKQINTYWWDGGNEADGNLDWKPWTVSTDVKLEGAGSGCVDVSPAMMDKNTKDPTRLPIMGFPGVFVAPCFENEAYRLRFYVKTDKELGFENPQIMVYMLDTNATETVPSAFSKVEGVTNVILDASNIDYHWYDQNQIVFESGQNKGIGIYDQGYGPFSQGKWIQIDAYFVTPSDFVEGAYTIQIQTNTGGDCKLYFDALSLEKISMDEVDMGVALQNNDSEEKAATVKFTKKSIKIKKGKKATLKVKLTGAKKATFSVDKKGKKVVKLSKKKAKSVVVTGKKKGKATITAKAAGKKATCKVTVK